MGNVCDGSGLPGLAAASVHQPGCAFLGGLFPTPLYHLGGLFPTPLYHLHPCRRASMQASFRWNDDGSDYEYLVIPAKAGIQWFIIHSRLPQAGGNDNKSKLSRLQVP